MTDESFVFRLCDAKSGLYYVEHSLNAYNKQGSTLTLNKHGRVFHSVDHVMRVFQKVDEISVQATKFFTNKRNTDDDKFDTIVNTINNMIIEPARVTTDLSNDDLLRCDLIIRKAKAKKVFDEVFSTLIQKKDYSSTKDLQDAFYVWRKDDDRLNERFVIRMSKKDFSTIDETKQTLENLTKSGINHKEILKNKPWFRIVDIESFNFIMLTKPDIIESYICLDDVLKAYDKIRADYSLN